MANQISNLAVVSNNTFKAVKSTNLHHYDISSALQTSLQFDELIKIFSTQIKHLVPHTGFIYTNDEFDLTIKQGIETQYSCSYGLIIENMSLGNLQLTCQQKFTHDDLELLETLLCCLIYPLKNATIYNQALKMAHTDPLTQTNNRSSFDSTLTREITLSKRTLNPLSVLFFDIDHFKHINDTYGHECGDTVLKDIAQCIKETIRNSDMIFRYGGEEFVILLGDTDVVGARITAEKIRQAVEKYTLAYGMEIIKLTASIGVSTLRANDSIQSLVKRADDAMYQAKSNGRNQVRLEALS